MTPSPVASLSQYSTSPKTTIHNVPTGGSGGIPQMTSPHVQQLSHLCPPFPDVVESNDSSLTSAQDNVTGDNSAKGKADKIFFPITDNTEFVTQLLFQQNALVFIKSTRYYNLYFCLCILSPYMFQPA
jgi:hypothetical protein